VLSLSGLPVRARRGNVVGRWWAGGKRGKLWDDAGGGLTDGDGFDELVRNHPDLLA
jgi:hypothetical protein